MKKWVSYEEAEDAAATVVRSIQEACFEPKKVVAIANGGLIPAYFIAKALKVPVVHAIKASSYNDGKKESVVYDKKANKGLFDDSSRVLVVDDLVDTGDTIDVICSSLFPGARTATLFVHHHAPEPDFFGVKLEEDVDWLVFPWEEK